MCDWKGYGLEEYEDRLARVVGYAIDERITGQPVLECHDWLDSELSEPRTIAHADRQVPSPNRLR